MGDLEAELGELDVGHHEGAGARPRALGHHDDVGVDLLAARETGRDAVAVVGQGADLLAEAVVGLVLGPFVQRARELAAQDLHLGRAAGGVVLARREGRDLRPVVVDEPQSPLAGPGLAGRGLEVHPAQDLPAGPPDVDVLPLIAQPGRAFDDGRAPPLRVELMGEGTDMSAIGELTQHGSMGTADLGRRLGISSASATVLVDRLERAGHVERVRDTADRRRVVLTVTETARAASFAAWLPAVREIDEVCRTLGDAEKAFAHDLLARLTAAVERSGRPAGTCACPEPAWPGPA